MLCPAACPRPVKVTLNGALPLVTLALRSRQATVICGVGEGVGVGGAGVMEAGNVVGEGVGAGEGVGVGILQFDCVLPNIRPPM